MATYEKRGFIKQYNEAGMLVSKVAKQKEEIILASEEVEEDLFGEE